MPFNNTCCATFLTRQRRKVLTIVTDKPPKDQPEPWRAWQTAMNVAERFQCDVRPVTEVNKVGDKELHDYAAVCVFQIVPGGELWAKLGRYVRGGGGLVLVPGGDEMLRQVESFNEEGSKAGLLPGKLQKIETVPKDRLRWSPFQTRHPIPAYFHKAITTTDADFGKTQTWPSVNAYWHVTPAEKDTVVLATYADKEHSPALLERTVGQGHVVLFTTPLDTLELDRLRHWHNYWEETSFGLVLEDQVCRYLAGDSLLPELNYYCGQVPRLPLPASLANLPYTLDGPGLAVAETNIKVKDGDTQVSLPQAVEPGNYAVRDANKRIITGCSLNVRPQESDLERVPAEEIESVLGKETLLQVGRTVSLKEALLGMRPPPLELLPWLMIAVLIVLAGESLLANRFYRRVSPVAVDEAPTLEQAQP
jgi:hypothetical protein